MTEPSQKALDYAARKAGFSNYKQVLYRPFVATEFKSSITAHARTLDELWAIKPPKTRGELFAEEMIRRVSVVPLSSIGCASVMAAAKDMIDEGWEPKDG